MAGLSKNAFICSTPVQILRAMHMKYAIERFSAEADIFIFNKFSGAMKIAENLEMTGLFRNVFLIEDVLHSKGKVLRLIFGFDKISKHIRRNKYDKLVCFNIENELANAIYYLSKHNSGFEYHCVEDAPGLYPLYEPVPYGRRSINTLLGIEKVCFHIDYWWFSQPNLMDIPANITTCKLKLPSISKQDTKFISIVNTVFDYKEDMLFNNADILIMEESFYTDNRLKGNSDIDIFKQIQNRYPQKNILVKLHPRTKENRFTEEFNIMQNTWIPWEVYLLNRSDDAINPVQIGIVCTSMSSDKFLFDDEGKKVVLAPIFYDKVKLKPDGTPGVGYEDTKKFEIIKQTYREPDKFIIAYNIDDVYKALDTLL